MRLIRNTICLLAFLCAVLTAGAQLPDHVRWSVSAELTSKTEGVVSWTAVIDAGWHIYGTEMPSASADSEIIPQLTGFIEEEVSGLTFTGPVTPSVPADVRFDDALKLNLPMWEGTVTFTRPFKLDNGAKGATLQGYVIYMACTDEACTPPTRYEFDLAVGYPGATPAPETAPAAEEPARTSASEGLPSTWAPVDIAAPDAGAAATSGSPWWVILGLGFLGGLLALLTPCVWPMIPMTMSFFLKKGKSRRRAIFDAVAYALSIVIIYLVLGIAITLMFGASKLNELATSAVFNVLFFVLLVIFAISFFGAFDIKLPSKWSNAIDSRAENTTGLLSIFFMAFTLVLVSFSCTGPIIGTLLVEAASQASILGPAVGMGGFALGLALPFGLFAFFPSLLKEMPRSGSWLNTVKVVLGFIELILSLKFLSVADLAYGWRILDREVFLALWIVLFALLGIYLLGKLRFSHDAPVEHVSVFRFFLAVASFSFAVYLVPGLWGAPLKSISAFAPPINTQDFNLYGGTFREFHDYDEGMQYARQNGMPVLVDFSGYACVNCRKMEGAVFDTPEVRSVIESDYVLIKLMVDDKTELAEPIVVNEYGTTKKLRTVGDRWSYLQRHKFGITTQPYYVVLDASGQPLGPARSYDENVSEFVDWLTKAAARVL
ncbi:MAG: thioredoxin family protein [Muribaculaceae bacterium]|nr:thioredoxin family protein [Muribaculaceae bacterium]